MVYIPIVETHEVPDVLLSHEEITEGLAQMDEKYRAMFSNWIKQERNLKQFVGHFCRTANTCKLPQIIRGVEWITKDWLLHSTITLTNQLTFHWKDEKDIALLVKALCEKWKTKYVSSFVSAIMERWNTSYHKRQQASPDSVEAQEIMKVVTHLRSKQDVFLRVLMEGWHFSRTTQLFLRLGPLVDWEVKSSVLKWLHSRKQLENQGMELNDHNMATQMGRPLFPIEERREMKQNISGPVGMVISEQDTQLIQEGTEEMEVETTISGTETSNDRRKSSTTFLDNNHMMEE